MKQGKITLCWLPPAKTYLPSPAMTMLKQTLQEACFNTFIIVMIFVALTCPAKSSAQSIMHDTRVGQFKTAIPSKKTMRPNSNRRHRAKRNSPKKLRTRALQKPNNKVFPVKYPDSKESQLSQNLDAIPSSIHDSVIQNTITASDSTFFVIDFRKMNAWIPNIKNENSMPEFQLGKLDVVANRTNNPIILGNFSFMGMQAREDHPLVLTTHRLSVYSTFGANNITLTTGIKVNRYFALGIKTQYGIQGSVSYSFSPNFSMTVFGEYYNTVPWFYMACFPYVATNRFGGYLTYRNNKIGTHIGAERYYDPFSRQWILRPIFTPFVKVSNKFFLELPLGGLLKEGSERLSHKDRRRGPIIMPNM